MPETPEPPLPFEPVAGVMKVSVRGHNAGSSWANVFHISGDQPGPFSASDLTTLAGDIFTLYGSTLEAIKVTTDTLEEVVVQDISTALGLSGDHTGSQAGTASNSPLPANVAGVISWKIARRYRGGKPRTYLSGMPDGKQGGDARFWVPSWIAAMEAAADGFRVGIEAFTTVSTGVVSLVCVHYFLRHALLTPPLVDTILGDAVDGRVCTQRRRLGRVLDQQAE